MRWVVPVYVVTALINKRKYIEHNRLIITVVFYLSANLFEKEQRWILVAIKIGFYPLHRSTIGIYLQYAMVPVLDYRVRVPPSLG